MSRLTSRKTLVFCNSIWVAILLGHGSIMGMAARRPEAVPPGNQSGDPLAARIHAGLEPSTDWKCSRNVHCERTLYAVVMTDQCYKPYRQITWTTAASAKMYFAAQREYTEYMQKYIPLGVALSERRKQGSPCSVTLSTGQTYIDSGWELCFLRRKNGFFFAWHLWRRAQQCALREKRSFILTGQAVVLWYTVQLA